MRTSLWNRVNLYSSDHMSFWGSQETDGGGKGRDPLEAGGEDVGKGCDSLEAAAGAKAETLGRPTAGAP